MLGAAAHGTSSTAAARTGLLSYRIIYTGDKNWFVIGIFSFSRFFGRFIVYFIPKSAKMAFSTRVLGYYADRVIVASGQQGMSELEHKYYQYCTYI